MTKNRTTIQQHIATLNKGDHDLVIEMEKAFYETSLDAKTFLTYWTALGHRRLAEAIVALR